MEELVHLHLTVNARVDPTFAEFSKEKAQAFVDELMGITGMKPLGPLNWADATDLDFPGQSIVQMITTSHSSLHYFSDTKEIYFDIYSCKQYDYKKVLKLLDRTFMIKEWHGVLYNRANGKEPKVKSVGSEKVIIVAREPSLFK
ncbi:MAG: S-adenosylmethionine decarboxylase [Candidatus Micrarchaeota archaeon]